MHNIMLVLKEHDCRCGPVAFQVPLEQEDKPNNILEEIVW